MNLPYGSTFRGVLTMPPSPDDYLWQTPTLPSPTLAEQLSPPAPATPDNPETFYPLSPTWQLIKSNKFLAGAYYAAPCSSLTDAREKEMKRMKKIVNPPNVGASWDSDGSRLITVPIPGMVRMTPGIPYVYHIDGDYQKAITVGCAHTLSSLAAVPEAEEIITLSHLLHDLTFGTTGSNEKPGIRPIYTLENLKRNDRSGKQSPVPTECYNGSYSIGSTIEQGHGPGKIVPAAQAAYAEAQDHICKVLMTLHKLYRLVMPYMMSKFELDITDFHSIDNNVIGIGGIRPCGTSVQMNVSSTVGSTSLDCALGQQGRFHGDFHDALPHPTCFIVVYRLPEGK